MEVGRLGDWEAGPGRPLCHGLRDVLFVERLDP